MGYFKQLVKELAEVWRIEHDKRREQKAQYRIEYAFTSGGRKYYRFADINNLPYQRGRHALAVYNEVQMRCSRKFLIEYADAVDKVLHANPIDIFKLNELNSMLKDRLTLVADLELCYKLASIVYFDSTEKPEVYEPEYAEKKIARWKKDMDVESFFLQQPLTELIPYLKNAVGDFNGFFLLNQQMNALHSDLMRLVSSMNNNANTMNGNKS